MPENAWTLAKDDQTFFGIYVDLPDFSDPETAEAAFDEFDWLEQPELGRQCGLAHAAVELRRILCRIVELDDCTPENFPWLNAPDERDCAIVVECENGDWDGYRIRSEMDEERRTIRITGKSPAGALYACYHLLELLGCRWCGLGFRGEQVPLTFDLQLPLLDFDESPTFKTRGFWPAPETFNQNGQRGNYDLFEWMAHNRMNFWCVGDTAASPGYLRQRGMHLTCGGRIFHQLLPPEGDCGPEHAGRAEREVHPEWYGLGEDGERSFPDGPFWGANFCTTNEDAVQFAVERALHRLAAGDWRQADSLSLWMQKDGEWCACDRCTSSGSPTDRFLQLAHDFRNALDDATKTGRLNRDVSVYITLEGKTLDPPSRPLPVGFDFEKTVIVFALNGRCYAHSISDTACTEYNKALYEKLRTWSDVIPRTGDLCILENHNHERFHDLPLLLTSHLQADVRAFAASGATRLLSQHVPRHNWGQKTLNYYLLSRVLWNPEQPLDVLLDDYFESLYADTAPHVRKLYEVLERALCNLTAWKFDFVERAKRGETKLFASEHLQFEGPDGQTPPTVSETMGLLIDYTRYMDPILEMLDEQETQVQWRIMQVDFPSVEYAQNTFFFYEALSRALNTQQGSEEWEQVSEEIEGWAQCLEEQAFADPALGSSSFMAWETAIQASLLEEVYRKCKE